MNVEMVERIGVQFTAEVLRPDGSVRATYSFHNLVLDVGLDALFDNSLNDMMDTVHVGDSSQAPATTDTGLISEVASTSNVDQGSWGGSSSPLYSTRTRRFVFAKGAAQGNLTEIGLSNGATTPIFLNRQLFRDGNGDPVTVTILADEILQVTAEGRIESDIQTTEQTTNDFTLDGTTITATRTAINTSSWTSTNNGNAAGSDFSADIPFDLIKEDDTSIRADSISIATYTSGDYASTMTITWNAGSLDGNYDQLVYKFYQFAFSPVIAVASTEELTLTVKRTWGRTT